MAHLEDWSSFTLWCLEGTIVTTVAFCVYSQVFVTVSDGCERLLLLAGQTDPDRLSGIGPDKGGAEDNGGQQDHEWRLLSNQ